MASCGYAALLAVFLGAAPPAGADARDDGTALKRLEQRVGELENRVAALQTELEGLRPQPRRCDTVYRLRNGAAADVASSVCSLLGDNKRGDIVVAEPITNKVLINAEEGRAEQLVKLLEALDALSR